MNNNNQEKKEEENSKGLISKFKLFFENDFFKNHIVLWLLVFNFIFNLANWIALAVFINKTQEIIILHYNVYFGVDNLGDFRQVFFMPAVGLVLFLINLQLAFFFYKNKERIASYVLLLTALMVQLNLIISGISVILINY